MSNRKRRPAGTGHSESDDHDHHHDRRREICATRSSLSSVFEGLGEAGNSAKATEHLSITFVVQRINYEKVSKDTAREFGQMRARCEGSIVMANMVSLSSLLVLGALLLSAAIPWSRAAEESHVGRKVVVLGASYGIGRATADLFADRGAHVVYASRSKARLEEAVDGRENCHAITIDASDEDSIGDGMAKAVELLGGLDMVLYVPAYFGEECYGSFERIFESGNFAKGYENSMNLAVKMMMKTFQHSRKHLLQSSSGCFIALSSIAAGIGHPGAALYAIAKAAQDVAIRQLSLEYAPMGLRVLGVAPGLIDTPAIENLGPKHADFMKEVGGSHAMERYGTAQEVAEFLAFLSSERASFITGGPYLVDGGATLRSSLGDALRRFTIEGQQHGSSENKYEL